MADGNGAAPGDVTRLLKDYAGGDERSLNEVIPIVYQELKGLARAQLRRSGVRQHIQTTVLVHEAFEKLTVGHTPDFEGRRHFFAIAARAMRQIVVDSYRSQMAAKRGAGAVVVALESNDLVDLGDPERVVQFDQAMERLATESEELAEVIDLSCFGGLSNSEIADVTGANVRTVQRKLLRAKAWLHELLEVPVS